MGKGSVDFCGVELNVNCAWISIEICIVQGENALLKWDNPKLRQLGTRLWSWGIELLISRLLFLQHNFNRLWQCTAVNVTFSACSSAHGFYHLSFNLTKTTSVIIRGVLLLREVCVILKLILYLSFGIMNMFLTTFFYSTKYAKLLNSTVLNTELCLCKIQS